LYLSLSEVILIGLHQPPTVKPTSRQGECK
jgi:hypothetical protein